MREGEEEGREWEKGRRGKQGVREKTKGGGEDEDPRSG